MASPGAVVIGGYINALGIVRSLAARGVPVAVVETQPYDIAGHSRLVTSVDRLNKLDEHPEGLVEIVERRAREWRGWALLPSTDEALAALADQRDALSAHHLVVAPPPDTVRLLLDKQRMYQAAEAVGLNLPTRYGVASAALAFDGIRYPVVVKPNAGSGFATRFGCKLLVARNAAELAASIARVESAGIPSGVYELVPGADDHIYAHTVYLDRRGEPRGALTIRKLRQSPSGFGVARAAELVPDPPELRDATIELARRIGIRGIAEAEWKRDARDGSYRFIEINGRSVIFNALLRKGGLDLAFLAFSESMQGFVPSFQPTGWPGVWINLHADLLHALLSRSETSAGWRQILAPYRRPLVEAVWATRDPAPFFAQWGRSARAALTSLARATWQQR
jgi:D-aspartate ligase